MMNVDQHHATWSEEGEGAGLQGPFSSVVLSINRFVIPYHFVTL
jgi:hypothetical protein